MRYAMKRMTTPVINDCIIANVAGVGIEHYGATVNIEHCTFYKVTKGVHIHDTITSTTALKNHLFFQCAYDVISDTTPLELGYSVTTGYLDKVTPDSDCIIGADVLFVDSLNDDFNIRHIEQGYPIASPGVDGADDSRDMGAYDVSFALDTVTHEEIALASDVINVERSYQPVKPDSNYTFTGNYKRSIISDYLENFTVTVSEDRQGSTELFYQFKTINTDSNAIQIFPNDTGDYTPKTNPYVTWLDKTSIDGLITIELSSGDIDDVIDFFGENEEPAGWYAVIKGIGEAVAPYDEYPVKIIESVLVDGVKGTITCENFLDKYPGSGFSSSPDRALEVTFVKSLFVGIFQYKEIVNGFYQFIGQGLEQTFQKDQWKDYYFHIDYETDLGSDRRYFRIDHNDSNDLYCEDILGNSAYISGSTDYHISIDLCMMKTQPAELSVNSPEGGALARHGNDFYVTQVCRDANTSKEESGRLVYNERGETMTLVMSRQDTDGSDL